MTAPLLEVENLQVTFPTPDGPVTAVSGVDFVVGRGETLGVVGESGSGKSVTSMAIMGLLPKRSTVTGVVRFDGLDLLCASERELCGIRGRRISMVFQDALTSLNPVYRVGDQIGEMISCHHDTAKSELRERVLDLLDVVGIPNPKQRIDQYPHEFSGGMRQRAMIAMAIANEPDLVIADEPTTALDVTVQAQVMEVFERIQERTSSALMLITHDLGVVAGVADRVMVMYAGRDVEQGSVDDTFYNPQHPYTQGLLASLPRADRREGGRKLARIRGNPPSLLHLPPGCPFWPRCPHAVAGRCDIDRPERTDLGFGRSVACVRHAELNSGAVLDG